MMRDSLLAAAALIMTAGVAHAACASFTAGAINVTYDPLGAQGVSQLVQPVTLLAARNHGTGPEIAAQFVDEDSTGTLRIGTRGPIYAVEDAARAVAVGRNAPQLGPANSFDFRFSTPEGGTEPVNGIRFVIDPGQDVPAGVFRETLAMQMRCGGGNAPVDLQSGVLYVTVDVPSTLIASLSGTGASGTLDLDDFSEPTRTALVNVYSTGPYALSISSDNGMNMKLVGAPAEAASAGTAQIPYALTFDGRPVLAGSSTRFARTGVGGAQLPLAVTVDSVAGKRAGAYHDAIVLTFTPLATL
jgi:hypothetical protein